MSTMDHPEVSSKQEEISFASLEVQQPQQNKFKRPDKTARHLMNILDKEELDKVQAEREIPDIRPGYFIKLKVEAPENEHFKNERHCDRKAKCRYSPDIKEIKVLEKKRVKRAKLYYLREI
ncbi:hypothetical protein ZIOFF_034914 [Zingiber officinale]|uniref:Uncharacterized protein n=1 Tax=Zingiber officinale TaxID=94328 RepID=A0A8J5KX58_ZINOF|nr:hypothetical protein ZIOFF_034914 [Zingiber officinale]